MPKAKRRTGPCRSPHTERGRRSACPSARQLDNLYRHERYYMDDFMDHAKAFLMDKKSERLWEDMQEFIRSNLWRSISRSSGSGVPLTSLVEDGGHFEDAQKEEAEKLIGDAFSEKQLCTTVGNTSDIFNNIRKRFVNVQVLVDNVRKVPKKLIYQRLNPNDSSESQQVEFRLIHYPGSELETIPERYDRAWQATSLPLAIMRHALSEVSARLAFSDGECVWKPLDGDATNTTNSGPSGAKPGPSEDKPGPSGDNSHSRDNWRPTEGDRSPSGDDHSPPGLQPLGMYDNCAMYTLRRNIDIVLNDLYCDDFMGILVKTFLYKSRNPCGCEGLYAVLNYACKVALGCSYSKQGMASVYQAGSAKYLKESFPVKCAHGPLDECSSLADESFHDDGSVIGSVHSCQSGLGNHYSDVIVASTDSEWSRILMTAEVKSDDTLDLSLSQIAREMAGALFEQNEVFGLLLCSTEAKLLRMVIDDLGKMRLLKKEYIFVSPDETFQREQLVQMFDDLVAAMAYAYKNIHREVFSM